MIFDFLVYMMFIFQKIYLPGDNDIGGEEDSVSARIHNRFKFAYTQPDTMVYKSVTFFKVFFGCSVARARARCVESACMFLTVAENLERMSKTC